MILSHPLTIIPSDNPHIHTRYYLINSWSYRSHLIPITSMKQTTTLRENWKLLKVIYAQLFIYIYIVILYTYMQHFWKIRPKNWQPWQCPFCPRQTFIKGNTFENSSFAKMYASSLRIVNFSQLKLYGSAIWGRSQLELPQLSSIFNKPWPVFFAPPTKLDICSLLCASLSWLSVEARSDVDSLAFSLRKNRLRSTAFPCKSTVCCH